MPDAAILHLYRAEAITLDSALSSCHSLLENAICLAYGPELQFVRLGDFEGARRKGVYEVRAFNAECELRWVADAEKYESSHQGEAVGNAVLLAENDKPTFTSNTFKKSDETISAIHTREDKYILWGERSKQTEGYVTLFEHRVGELKVPFNGQINGNTRLALKFREYFVDDAAHGNVAVKAERLLGIEAIKPEA